MEKMIVHGEMWRTVRVALYWTMVRELEKNEINHALKRFDNYKSWY